jgi:hypothetical protein
MSASTLRLEGPFLGLPIIDMTHVLAGPFGTNIFNYLGSASSRSLQVWARYRAMSGHRPSRPRRAAERPSPVAGFDRINVRIAFLINEQ